jgi:hypothetical protein
MLVQVSLHLSRATTTTHNNECPQVESWTWPNCTGVSSLQVMGHKKSVSFEVQPSTTDYYYERVLKRELARHGNVKRQQETWYIEGALVRMTCLKTLVTRLVPCNRLYQTTSGYPWPSDTVKSLIIFFFQDEELGWMDNGTDDRTNGWKGWPPKDIISDNDDHWVLLGSSKTLVGWVKGWVDLACHGHWPLVLFWAIN